MSSSSSRPVLGPTLALILAVLSAVLVPATGGLGAQEVTYRACRVPGVGPST